MDTWYHTSCLVLVRVEETLVTVTVAPMSKVVTCWLVREALLYTGAAPRSTSSTFTVPVALPENPDTSTALSSARRKP